MPKFDANVLKTQIKLAMGRIRLQQNKKGNSVKQQKREIAELLARGSDESARIKVESVIREDFIIEAFEILLLFCELLLARLAIISMEKHCPEEVKEAVYTIIYAAPRTEIPELRNVSSLLTSKFGSQIATQANDNCCGQVNARIVHKLRISTPETFLVYQYLNEIAKSHGVNWSYNPPEEFNPSLGLGSLPHTIASPPLLVGSSTMVTLPAPGGAVFPVFPTVPTQAAPPNTSQFPAFHNAFAPNNQTGVFPSFPNVPQQGGFPQQPNPNNVFPSFPNTPSTMPSQQNPSNPGFPSFPQTPNFSQQPNPNNVFPSFPSTPSTTPSQSNTNNNPSNTGFPNFPQTPNYNQSQQPNPNVFPSFPNTPSTTPSQLNQGIPNFPQAPNFNPNTNTNTRQIGGGDNYFPSFPNPPSDSVPSNLNTGFPNFPQTPSTQQPHQPPSNRNENALGDSFPSFPSTPSTTPSQSNTNNNPSNSGFPNFPQTPNFNPNTKQGNGGDNAFPSFPAAPSQTKPNTNANVFPSFPNSRNIEADNNNVVDLSSVHLDLPSVPKQGFGSNNTQSSTSSANDDLPDFDELSARFEALKKRNQ